MAFRLDQFEIRDVLGAGGMAVVYAGTDLATQEPVAVKILTRDEARAEDQRRAFVGEARSAARLRHPGIVQVLDVGEVSAQFARETGLFAPGAPYLVMERVPGVPLDRSGDIDWATLRRLVLDLLDALAHAHALGVIHRDIKPSNILIETLSRRPRLTDFGIARIFDIEGSLPEVERERRIAGTPNYMAPERVMGHWRDQGPWTDLYSLGILVWKIVTGEHPFRGTSEEVLVAQVRQPLPEFAPRIDVPERLELWLAGLLAKSPHQRFRRAADAAAAFAQVSRTRLRHTPAGLTPVPSDRYPLPTLTQVLERAPRGARYPRVTGLVADWQRPPVPANWRGSAQPAGSARRRWGLGLHRLRIPPIVGREAERDALWQMVLEVVRTGGARGVQIVGPPGVGKTRLAQWLTRRAVEVGAADVHRITNSGLDRSTDGLAGMVRRFFRTDELDPPEVLARVRAELYELPHGQAPFAAYDATVLARILTDAGGDGPRGATHLSPMERFYAAWRLMQSLGVARPQILWVEDAHAGIEGLRFARFLLERAADDLPLLVVVTARTDGPPDAAADELAALTEAGAVRLVLGPLESGDLRDFVREGFDLSVELAEEVARRAGGIPMFAVQAIDEMIEREALARDGQGYALVSTASLPDDAHALWTQRIERVASTLDSERDLAADALLVAAMLGRWVETAEWAAVLERVVGSAAAVSERARERLVEELERRGLAERQQGGWLFAHTTMRESLLRIAREQARADTLHRSCAETLASLHGPDRGPAAALRIADHLAGCGDLRAALDELLHGIRVAKELRENDWLERLLLAADRATARTTLAADDARHGELLSARARLLTHRNRLREARDLCEALIVRASECGWTRIEGEATYQLGSVELSLGHTERAIALFQRATQLCRHVDDAHNLARSREGTGYALLHQGRFEEARPEIEAAGQAYLELQDLRGFAFNRYHFGIIARYEGDLARARELYEECLQLSELLAFRDTLANAHNALGDLDRQEGDLDSARAHYRTAYELWSAVGAAGGNVASINLAITLVQQGRWDDAAAVLLPLAAQLQRAEAGMQLTFALAALLPVHAAREELEAFDDTLSRFGELKRRFGLHDPDLELLSDICVGKWHRSGDRARLAATRRAFSE